jgi:TolB-like protein
LRGRRSRGRCTAPNARRREVEFPLGSLQLDKMTETIEAFALGSAASVSVATSPRSSEPLLAVLPFDNLSDDREMQFFSDGVSEEIIQRLSRGAQMKVIGRTSSFQFRGTDKIARNVAKELHCSHILDGSIRRAGGRVRIAAHLVDAVSQTTL